MKSLSEHVSRIHSAYKSNDLELCRKCCHEMVDYSDAKPITKRKHHIIIDRKPDALLQFWAEDYRMAGEGLGVIK
jgi:hypothetical protein